VVVPIDEQGDDAAGILGISRPLVVYRMDIGDLPFRYADKHWRSRLKDVLALKARIDAQCNAMEALAGMPKTSSFAMPRKFDVVPLYRGTIRSYVCPRRAATRARKPACC